MKVDDLLLLADVHRAGSLSAAARSLALPKATVSRRLVALEAAVGARLFVPGAPRLKLTDFGAQLAERAVRHHDDIDETRQWISARDATPRGVLRLSVPAEFASLLLADTFARFVQRYPAVQLDIDTAPRRVDLVNEGIDLALRIGPIDDEPHLVARRFMLLERGLYASPLYLAQRPAPLKPEDLATHRFVLLNAARGQVQRLVRGRRVVEVAVQGPLHCNAISLALALTRAGAGIASFPHGMVWADVKAGALQAVLPSWGYEPLPVTLLTASRRLMPAKTRAFIDHLFETVPQWVHP